MLHWTLIVFYMGIGLGSGTAVHSVPMETPALCEAAKKEIKSEYNANALCVQTSGDK